MDITSLRLPILICTVVVNILLAIVVYKNNSKSATNQIFASLSAVTVLWLIDVYLSVTPAYIAHSLLWVRLSVFFAAAQIMLFFLLAQTLPSITLQIKKGSLYLLFGITAVVMATSLSPFAFTRADISGNQVQAIPGPGMGLFVVFAISLSVGAIITLIKRLRASEGRLREQYRYVLIGLGLMLGLLIATVLIPVAFLKNSSFVPLAPLYAIIFLGATTFAIIRHQLFDIRSAIARSVAYVLAISAFVISYTFAALGVSYLIFNGTNIDARQNISYIVLALLFSPTLYWLKRAFDKVTNKVFYQDAYDSQEFLNQLNKIVVSTIEVGQLLSRSSRLIGQTVKSEFCDFVIWEINEHPQRVFGDSKSQIDSASLAELRQQTAHFNGVVVTDALSDEYAKLRKYLSARNIGMLAPLATASHSGKSGYGYLLMGAKKSGYGYTRRDVEAMEIVSDELAIAAQNALRFEEIKGFNDTLSQKVEDATRELRKTNVRLRMLDQTKDDFISMASHQLRTPLTSVKGYVSMVLDGDAGKITPLQRKMLSQSFISSQRMSYLISDLLNLSRLRTGKFVIESTEVDLSKMIEEELGQLIETATSRGLQLTYHKPKHFPLLFLDETKIRQVIMNFVDNAVYYTPSGGHIDVFLKEKPESIEFTVVDDGIGVPRHEQHHLFTKFYRAHNAKRARPDGTGLGLFMARKVIAAQGGAVIFKSKEGAGSTFGFTFAKSRLAVPQPSVVDLKTKA